jgi:geranylgeranyl diphosphate synthase type II
MLDFAPYLKERATRVEAALDAVLSETAYPDIPARLRDAMRYSLLNGGKRVRPILCLAASEAVGGNAGTAMPAALAIEVLHTYTLVHDDLPCMDDDVLRRGQPTVHVKYGYAEAVLAGDALQALAFELVARLDIPAGHLRTAVSTLCHAAGAAGVIGGQWEDVTARPPHDATRIAYVHQHKTADILACAAALGAIAGGGSQTHVAALARYGNCLGLAFQIIDDLLDEPERATKTEPELSCLDVWTTDEARSRAAEHTRQAHAALDGLPGPTEPLHALVAHLLDRTV